MTMTEDELLSASRGLRSYTRHSSEDELLLAVTEALSLTGWRWQHVRRSDAAIVQGMTGWPDIIAIHPTRAIAMALELKADRGQVSGEQAAWGACLELVGIPFRIVRPDDLDSILRVIVGAVGPLTLDTPAVAEAARE
jgi:hypothetical protein